MGVKAKIFVALSKYRMLLPFVVAQAKLETNNFTSPLYLKHNNMFGMKMGTVISPWELEGPESPEGGKYAAYRSDFDSLKDLIQYFEWKKFPVTVKDASEYARELWIRGYFGVSQMAFINYDKNLNFWIKKS